MEDHNKIIRQTAKTILSPHGFFQVGLSRTWLYDCGYFFAQIGFQPSAWTRGSYCNVGIGFLFEYPEESNTQIAFNYGFDRIGDFIEYDDDDQSFRFNIERMARSALEYAKELMKFKSLEYADAKLSEQLQKYRNHLRIYDSAMVKFLLGEFEAGMALLDEWKEGKSDSWPWFQEWVEKVYPKFKIPRLTNDEAANTVKRMINQRRNYFAQKPSFKKMNKLPYNSLLNCSPKE